MKPFLPLLVATMGAMTAAHAADVTPEQALARLNESAPKMSLHSLSTAISSGAYKLNTTVGNLYVFSRGVGFVVLPADDAAPALLAYSDTDNFDIDANPSLAYWMDFYNSEIEYLKQIGASTTNSTQSWRTARPEIKPMTKTEWNQEAPYNEMCPKVDGRGTVTGCVATAMAQILKYHNYPLHGKGAHSYFWRPGEEELTFDYENTLFQWDLMTDRYDSNSTAESRHAVAELMYACGVSVDMDYNVGESGASTTMMAESLIDIFDYSPALWLPYRAFYGYDEWEEMIYTEIAEGRPVLYSGAGTAGGHQFICDGYSSDGFFHFNWGWGGLSDGYFLLTALNPDALGVGGGAGGFNTSQTATLGVRPPKEGDRRVYLMYNTEAFRSDDTQVKTGDYFTATGLYFNYSLSDMPDGSRLGMKFTSATGDEVKYVEGPGVGGYHPLIGRRNIQVKFPELSDGTYVITPALHADGKWLDVRMPVGQPSQITVNVTDGVATVHNQQAATVTLTDVQVAETIYRERAFPMPFTLSNTGTEEYFGSVTPLLLDADGTVAAKSQFRPVDILAGETSEITDYVADFKAEEGHEFPAGDYKLVFTDEAGRYISTPRDVKVEILTAATEIKVSSFRLDGENPVVDPATTRFAFNLACESGMFYGSLRLYIFPGTGGQSLFGCSTDTYYLMAGENKDVDVTADLSKLDDGRYIAAIYDGSSLKSDYIYFRIDRTSGITVISTDDPTDKVYDLNGRPVNGDITPGIYIVNGKKVFIRN